MKHSSHHRILRVSWRGAFALAALVVTAPMPAQAQLACPSGKVTTYNLREGETRVGDAYLFAKSIDIAGSHEGDLIAFAESIEVPGTITGDVNVFGNSLSLDGTAGDTVRFFGRTARVNGTVEGDLIAFCESLIVGSGAHITGKVLTYAAKVTMNGVVDGDLRATGGELVLGGKVGKNVTLKCDALTIDPEARIGGDLHYIARTPVDLEGKGIVAGRIEFEEKKEDEDTDEGPAFTLGKVGWWGWWTAAALVVGLLWLAVFRKAAPEIASAVGGDALRSLGVGFVAATVVPVATIIICILIVTIPLAIVVFVLYVVALYVAKVPVAVWLGRRVLRWLGRPDPSLVAGLVLGMLILYLVFKIPYLGDIAWLACLFLGLGAMVMGTRSYLRAHAPRAAAPPLPASSGSVSPATG